ncbi:S66 family peptidase [Butyrivibrio sp. AE2032]|uniref:S66 family peptidase n=1 Tax=Butyrivibrio sp. AE2032 TaxID=1458463 RepID=UPI00054CF5F8|nr:S66 peptidase family protein [Butyrivibrio sp. AE2032]
MIRPGRLHKGDTIAIISPSWGCAGSPRVLWKYHLGCQRLKELGLNVVPSPNALRGTEYLKNNPQSRADDIMWAFRNKEIKAVMAAIGGNDAATLLPYLSAETITCNPKIFCGYSDVMALHLFCFRAGLMTFYGDNLLPTVAETGGWHPYSRYWFEKVFFDSAPIGEITASKDWSFSKDNLTDKSCRKTYTDNSGYCYVQGKGKISGRLFGGHGDLRTIRNSDGSEIVRREDMDGSILFFEDIPEFCTVDYMADFFDWLGVKGYLQILKGVIIGKMRMQSGFEPYAERIRQVVTDKYHCADLPVMGGLNFGHSSPMFILPYGAEAELDIDSLRFRITESGVV